MIAYGYIVDLDKLKGKKRGEFCDFIDNSELSLLTGYSVGSFDPGMAVIGKIIDGTNFLFGPTLLKDLNIEPDEEDKTAVDSFDLSSIDQWKECLENTEPGVIIYDDTDD